MVQKEVKKKTSVYTTVAVLSALVLVSMVYVLGTAPIILPPFQTPTVSGMKSFSTLEEISNHLNG